MAVHRGEGAGGGPQAEDGQPSFEEAFARLEEIVRELEAGDIRLERSLSLFEEGIRLARTCARRLDEAETRVRVLLEGEEGQVRTEPFEPPPAPGGPGTGPSGGGDG